MPSFRTTKHCGTTTGIWGKLGYEMYKIRATYGGPSIRGIFYLASVMGRNILLL